MKTIITGGCGFIGKELTKTLLKNIKKKDEIVLLDGLQRHGNHSELQELLIDKGLALSIDSDFGPTTELVVSMFQKTEGLVADGIVGQKTWAALRS